MDFKDIFVQLANVVIESVQGIESWQKACLYVKRLKGNTGFESTYINKAGDEIKIDTTADYYTHRTVGRLYELTQHSIPNHKDWNRAIFTLFPNGKFEIEYIWDQALQDEVDGYNNGAKPIT